MRDLFSDIEISKIPNIHGLAYVPDFITEEEEQVLIKSIDSKPWLTDLKRRVQHYGYRYDYKARKVAHDAYIGTLPEWLDSIARRLYEEGCFYTMPDQVIVNEYAPGQGISAHIDCIPCFGEVIASLTLGSGVVMCFQNVQGQRREELYLEKCSLIVLSGTARYEWTHAIPARKSDIVKGLKIERNRRVSLTFRKVIVNRE